MCGAAGRCSAASGGCSAYVSKASHGPSCKEDTHKSMCMAQDAKGQAPDSGLGFGFVVGW